VDPRVRLGRDAAGLQDLDDLEGGLSVAGVDGQGQAGVEVTERPCLDELAVDLREGPRVHPDLDEARTDAGALDPIPQLARPPGGELPGRLGVGVLWHRDVPRRAVVAGVRVDVEAARLRETTEEARVVARPRGLLGPGEVHENVLVDERHPHTGDLDRPPDRVNRAGGLRPLGGALSGKGLGGGDRGGGGEKGSTVHGADHGTPSFLEAGLGFSGRI
jgi:hypothetical protein